LRARIPLLAALLVAAACGRDQPVGEITGARLPAGVVDALQARQDAARGAVEGQAESASSRRILFGDLHVHTTYSIDAFVYSLSFFGGGGGTRPPADACDFARYCSQLDFFALTDHSEALLPERWQRSKESIRQCNALAGDPADPDLVAFMGWEWTQVGKTPETHYGHKNVIFPGLADDRLPARPITSLPQGINEKAPMLWPLRLAQLVGPLGMQPWADFLWWLERVAQLEDCDPGVDTRNLPLDCRENAPTPERLFEKLNQWGFPVLVIPHGLAWGVHAPPGSRLDNQLLPGRHDPEKQRLIEIYSGHGNSEEFRDFAEFVTDADGERVCPEPTPDYLPCCWRAGEIIRERCGDLPEDECERRVREARRLALEAGREPHRVIPDAREEDWLDCDQCRDCFKPAFDLRPGETSQYGAALTNFSANDSQGRPLRFRWGYIGSSDDHHGQPGTGYKQFARKRMTDAKGVASKRLESWVRPWIVGEQEDPQRAQPLPPPGVGLRSLFDSERGTSFLYTGGLVAVHAEGRSRGAIWDALQRREVYGTSGPRILLWFDLLNAPGGAAPMGSAVQMREVPRFEVRAVGSFVQKPGCPDHATGLPAERLQKLCLGECYNPGDERHAIVSIEVVRVRPQATPGEPVAPLIEDPWRSFECEPSPAGCVVRFEDPEYATSGRDAVYYVRALQEETLAINGAGLRVEFDDDGKAVRSSPCYGNYRLSAEDDCLAPVQERAASSPIYVDQPLGDGP
jgi:hypothetical protein